MTGTPLFTYRRRCRPIAVLLLTWLALLDVCAFAGTPRSLRFDQLDVEQGLPQESVMAITQDADGYIWLGTQTGLARYDGYRTTLFRNDPQDARSLSDSWVQMLFKDSKDRLWVGTRRGLDRYDPASGGFIHYRPAEAVPARNGQSAAPLGNVVNALAEDRDGGLWLGTEAGLARLDPDTGAYRVFQHDEADAQSLSSDQIFSLALAPDGDLWIGTVAGVNRLPAGKDRFERYRLLGSDDNASKRNMVRALRLDAEGVLWVGSMGGIERWKLVDGQLERLPFPPGSPAETSPTSVILADHANTLWIGTAGAGMLRHDASNDGFLVYRKDPLDRHTLADNQIYSLFQDRAGSLWIGTWSGGANRVDLTSGGFERYTSESGNLGDGLSNNKVYGISGNGKGTLWLTTREGGLNRLDVASGKVTAYRHREGDPDSLDTDTTVTSTLDDRGRLWIATDKGLSWMDPAVGKIHPWQLKGGNSLGATIYCLHAEPGGAVLWLCTRGGLRRLDTVGDEMVTYNHDAQQPDSLSHDFVTTLLANADGTLWVGTFGGGLDLLDPRTGRFSHHRHDANDPASVSSDRIQTLMHDRAGTLWVGSSAGINRAEAQPDGSLRFTAYGSAQGLGADSIGGVLQDDDGNFWISTTAGISRFDPGTESFRNYTTSDGVTDGSFFIGSAWRDGDGTMYFGGVGGVVAIRQGALRDNPVAPVVAITDLLIFNRSVQSHRPDGFTMDGPLGDARSITLTHDLSVLTIEFSALHYADPRRNRYAYRLRGFDRDWTAADAGRRFTTYTNLDPGSYVFEVKASNKDGLWSEAPTTLAITILPPFWMTWWFRAGLALLLVAVVGSVFLSRIGRLKKQAEVLERRIAERTSQLADALASLEQASLTDPLTGMRNRRFAQQHMDADVAIAARAWEKTNRSGLAAPVDADLILFLVDIDHFKQVNDRHGHAAGDAVLAQFHTRLKPIFRDTDYLVRWGGEEFLIVARGTRRDKAPILAERICRTIADGDFVLPDGSTIRQTCSVGFASFPFVTREPAALGWTDVVDIADTALYAAKADGRNAWVGIHARPDAEASSLMHELRTRPRALFDNGTLALQSNLDCSRLVQLIGDAGQAAG